MSTALAADPRAIVPMSWEEYDDWVPPPDQRGEYLDGSFVMAPAPSLNHQLLSKRLIRVLDDVVTKPYLALQDVEWTPDDKREAPVPDLSVFWPTPGNVKRIVRTPILTIEIVSSHRSYDLAYKRDLYAAWGVPTYWIVDPPNHALDVHRLVDGDLVVVERHMNGCPELTFGPFSVGLDLDALFDLSD